MEATTVKAHDTFSGGVHPADNKYLSAHKPTVSAAIPKRVVIPLSQHIGAPTKPLVVIGQEVKKGEKIGETTGFVSAPVHASISGKVVAIASFPHILGVDLPGVVIESDGKDEWVAGLKENSDYNMLSSEELKKLVQDAGIVGMGGATFPTHVKLSPPKEKPIDVVILNGAECEPYLTSDHRLMLEKSKEIVEGLRILMRILNVSKGYIGIESNKPDAIEAMNKAVAGSSDVKVWPVKVKYPQGAEKMLIKAIAGRTVPAGGLPMDIGVVVQNVGTAEAIYNAVRYGRPLIERYVTVTGRGVKEPKNFLARIGTPFSQLIEEAGGLTDAAAKVISGGPMMGMSQYTLDVPVIKGTSGITVLTKEEVSTKPYGPCIRCARCIDACPMKLQPSLIGVFIEKGHYQDAKDYNLMDCFECGSCTFVCPANRPIVQWVKKAKKELAKKKN
ncbi:MAG TPA: electron transport complex subunit RsxC [Thermodesulfobacteriota bacterium]|nr:electron transport complex subunit RsxC [Thermodesulfobacteriota bacterium]